MADIHRPPSLPAVQVTNLSYKFPDCSTALDNVNLTLPKGSCTVLIGANGAGKTTLLRLLSGRRLSPPGSILISNMDPFTTTLPHVTYLGMEWVLNPTVRSDISVTTLLSSVGGDAYPDRRDVLIEILDVDTAWHMHSVSDGERRRVQLAMGLIRPWNVLLLDEVTVDLDVLARHRFLAFLKAECESRGATVVYATHVVECLNGWASHVCRVAAGKIKMVGEMEAVLMQERRRLGVKEDTGLLTIAVKWLEEDLIERGPRRGGKSESVAYGDVVKVDFSIKR